MERDVRFTLNSDRESGFSQRVMSALPPKADMCGAIRDVCCGPQAGILFSNSKNETILLSDLRQKLCSKGMSKKVQMEDLEAERESATMTIAESIRSSKHETICGECGSAVVAPEFVEHFSEEQLVLNFWSCPNCGFRFETEEMLSADVEPRVAVRDEVELFPESFFPSPRFE